jgi:hypothetical protein
MRLNKNQGRSNLEDSYCVIIRTMIESSWLCMSGDISLSKAVFLLDFASLDKHIAFDWLRY